MTKRVDYGVDGYPLIIGLLLGGTLGIAAGGVVLELTHELMLGTLLFLLGSAALVPGLMALRYVRIGKHLHRDRMLDLVTWRGDEQVLDVGTGGGLMLIGAAKRAPHGRAIGIDVWNPRDLSGNTRQRALEHRPSAEP
jgi:arsenite methyltransferase